MHLSIPPLDFYTLGHVLEMTDWSKSDIALDSCREENPAREGFCERCNLITFPIDQSERRGSSSLESRRVDIRVNMLSERVRQEWTGLVELQGQNHLSVDEALKLLLSLCFQFRLFKFDKYHYFSCPGLVSQSGIAILEFEDTKIIPESDTTRP